MARRPFKNVKTDMLNNMIPLFLGNLRGWEIIIIILAILLLFGGKKIPELMHGIGKGIRSFKKGMSEIEDEIKRPVDDDDKKSSTPTDDKK